MPTPWTAMILKESSLSSLGTKEEASWRVLGRESHPSRKVCYWLLMLLLVFFLVHPFINPPIPIPLFSSLYNFLSRLFFSISLSDTPENKRPASSSSSCLSSSGTFFFLEQPPFVFFWISFSSLLPLVTGHLLTFSLGMILLRTDFFLASSFTLSFVRWLELLQKKRLESQHRRWLGSWTFDVHGTVG